MKYILALLVLCVFSLGSYADTDYSAMDRVYRMRCASCHGNLGEKTNLSPVPVHELTIEQIQERLRRSREEGSGSIDRVKATLSEEEATEMAHYISEILRQRYQQHEAK